MCAPHNYRKEIHIHRHNNNGGEGGGGQRVFHNGRKLLCLKRLRVVAVVVVPLAVVVVFAVPLVLVLQ